MDIGKEPDFASDAYFDNPQQLLCSLSTKSPVYWSPQLSAWLVLRFEEVEHLLRHPALSSRRSRIDDANASQFGQLREFYLDWLMYSDAPRHTEVKKIIGNGITSTIVDRGLASLAREAGTLIATLRDRAAFDGLEDYALPLSSALLCEIVGIPINLRGTVAELSLPIVDFLGRPDFDSSLATAAQEASKELLALVRSFFDSQFNRSDETLIDRVAIATDRGNVELCRQVIAAIVNLLVDGHEPVATCFANGMLCLAHQTGAAGIVTRAATRVEGLIEEILRFEAPFQYCGRIATDDIRVRDVTIRNGQKVMLMIATANRDPQQFSDEARFKPSRTRSVHLSFGGGAHSCPGAYLSRKAVPLLFETMFGENRSVVVDLDECRWKKSVGYRGPEALPLRWQKGI